MLDELGRYDEALEALDRAIALDEREALPWRNKVWLHLQRGDVAAAEACADEMMEKASDSASALNVKASILTTWRGDDAQALVYLRQAFSTAPYDTSIASNLAEVLLNLASYEESRAIARTVLDLDLEDHIRCAMLFVTYASLVLEGAEAAARHEAFSQLVNFYRTTLFEGSSSASGWNYDALLRSIPKTAGGDTEAAFLLTTLIDIQARRFDGTSLSFFGARSGPE
jgi:tetratricopeptide (TPR) repeat protein